jgi:hypothetical protein
MPQTETLILRAALEDDKSVYRDIEIEGSKSLYELAAAIVTAFGFDFDHAFGFYSGEPYEAEHKHPCYELFADMGDADPGVLGVEKTKIAQAFPEVGHKMIFLFDYGDDWRFTVSLKAFGRESGNTRYPRIVASQGEAPPQYPDPNEFDGEEIGPSWGWNPQTGEKMYFGK